MVVVENNPHLGGAMASSLEAPLLGDAKSHSSEHSHGHGHGHSHEGEKDHGHGHSSIAGDSHSGDGCCEHGHGHSHGPRSTSHCECTLSRCTFSSRLSVTRTPTSRDTHTMLTIAHACRMDTEQSPAAQHARRLSRQIAALRRTNEHCATQ